MDDFDQLGGAEIPLGDNSVTTTEQTAARSGAVSGGDSNLGRAVTPEQTQTPAQEPPQEESSELQSATANRLNQILGIDKEKNEGTPSDKNLEKIPSEGEDKEDKSSAPGDFKYKRADKRDYSQFTEEEAKLLRQLPNPAFAYVSALALRHKEAAKKLETLPKLEAELATLKATPGKVVLPASYYEHENAFTLDPSYKELENYVGVTKAVVGHWQKQLAAIKANQPWQDLEDVLDAKGEPTGQIRLAKTYQANPEAEAMIINALIAKQQQLSHADVELGKYKENFFNNRKTLVTNIKAEEDKIFPQYKDKSDDNVNKVLSFLDTHGLKSDLLASPFAKALSTIAILSGELDKLRKTNSNGANLKQLTRQGPLVTKGSGAESSSQELGVEEMNRLADRIGGMVGRGV